MAFADQEATLFRRHGTSITAEAYPGEKSQSYRRNGVCCWGPFREDYDVHACNPVNARGTSFPYPNVA